MKRLLRLLTRRQAEEAPFVPDIAPGEPLAVIGDVHGRDDLLALLLGRLGTEAPRHRVVLVGDYIDRGEQSAAVLARLRSRDDMLCLMGNHEAMCLAFLEDPAAKGARWLRNGGLQTLSSFGVRSQGLTTDGDALRRLRDDLALAMGDDTVDWMRALPTIWRSGNLAVVHAGADPALPPEDQDPKVLLWGHPRFEAQVRADGLWVVHGHTIVETPLIARGRIGIDTGAYATGRLSAVLLGHGSVDFLST